LRQSILNILNADIASFAVMNTSLKDMNNDRAHANGDGATGKASGQLLFSLEFVNMNVASKAEKQMNQKVVRSVAMRSYRQKQQFRRTKEEEAKIRNRTRAVQPRSESKGDNHSTAHSTVHSKAPGSSNAWTSGVNISNISWLVSASPSTNLSDIDSGFEPSLEGASPSTNLSDIDSGFEPSLEGASLSGNHSDGDSASGESPQSNALSDPRSRDISPISLLGGGRIDPFQMSSSDTGPYIHELIDHCKSVSP
jgi:hypothetical protein